MPERAGRTTGPARPGVYSLAAVLLLASACTRSATEAPGPGPGGDAVEITVRLHPERERQVIHNFGASDAWSTQFVGAHWPVAKRERIADLLFGLELHEDGSPRGIGLSAWRFNIGGGSTEQGEASGIRDEWRRAESFLRADGSFDGSRQAGQRWFLRAARDRGVQQFTGFVNSPPVHFTRNGLAHSSGGAATNLRADRFADFAAFIRDVVVHLEREDGVRLDYVSPVNEPQWDWEGGQEGSPWLNSEIRDLVVAMSDSFQAAGLSTEIEITEAGKLNYLYEDADRPGRGDQVAAFFDPASPLHIGDLPNVARKIAAHSYFTTYPNEELAAVRERVRDRIREVAPELEFWMSEYCVLENNPEIRGPGRDLGMTTALYVARVIHADLTIAEASSWQWWLGVSPYDYKDGLVYIDRDRNDGAVYESKLLWTLGHFSRFVRPGMRRIEVEVSVPPGDPAAGAVLVSAFRDSVDGRTVAVLVNSGSREIRARLDGLTPGETRHYLTTEEPGVNLRHGGPLGSGNTLRLPSRSVATVVHEL